MTEVPRDGDLREEARDKSFGENLRTTREAQGITLSELARRAGVSKAYLSQLERELNHNPSGGIVSRIADGLELPVDRIWNEELIPDTSRTPRPDSTGMRIKFPPAQTIVEFTHTRGRDVIARNTINLRPGDSLTVKLRVPQ